MGGGFIELERQGIQNTFLIGNPQITFFKIVYKRFTNFAKECIEEKFNKTIKSNELLSHNLTKTGDLVQEIYFNIKAQFEPIANNPIYGKYDITNIIEYVEIEIGGQKIDKHYSQWLDIYNELFEKNYDNRFLLSKMEIYKSLLDYIYELDNTNSLISPIFANNFQSKDFNISMTTPIPSSINTCEFNITFISTSIPSINFAPTLKTNLNDLINKIFKEHNLQITINSTTTLTTNIYKINITSNDIYSVIDLMEKLCNNPHKKERNYIIPLKFWFNKNAGLALPLISLQYHTVKINIKIADLININWGNCKINNNILDSSLLVNYIYLDTNEKKSFVENKHEYLIEQIQYIEPTIITNNIINKIELNFNHPIKGLFWTTDRGYVKSAELVLNGHDVFSEDGNYFHLVQPYECDLGLSEKILYINRTWNYVDNINNNNRTGMYSFSLKPNEYQPSGSCNFSKIKYANFNIIGININKIYIYALNYNILKIINGMCNLTYLN